MTPEQKEILNRAIHKAATAEIKRDPTLRPDDIMANIFESAQEGQQYYSIIFNRKFARAVGYKLNGLAAWIENGGNPIDYLRRFC